MQTLAMVQTAPRTLEQRELPLPDIGDDDGLLRVEACGICGSDCEQFTGVLPVQMPIIPGHEPLGFIEKVGKNAAKRWGVREGDRVVVEPILSCGHCDICRRGLRHLCSDMSKGFRCYSYIPLATAPSLWGAYSQFMYLDADTALHKIDATLPPEIAVLYNPIGAGFRWAGELGGIRAGDTVLVIGPGQRGLASVIVAKAAGAERIIVSGLSKDRDKLALAESYGATHTINVDNDDLVKSVREITKGTGADVTVEVSAYAVEPVAQSLSTTKRGGTIVLAGVKGMKEVPGFVSDLAVVQELTIKGALGVTSSAFRNAIDLIEEGEVDLASMHTHSFALTEAETAVRTLAGEIEGENAIACCLLNDVG
jgi:threonine dehydrogenase-like Zn-dependent dehydrogenase